MQKKPKKSEVDKFAIWNKKVEARASWYQNIGITSLVALFITPAVAFWTQGRSMSLIWFVCFPVAFVSFSIMAYFNHVELEKLLKPKVRKRILKPKLKSSNSGTKALGAPVIPQIEEIAQQRQP